MSDKILKLSQAQTLYQDLRERSAPVITKSAIGNPIVFTDGADGLSLSKCKLTLLPRQSGSGDASPENIRPLIPWENVGTWTGGKNLFDINIFDRNGITATKENGKAVLHGTADGSAYNVTFKNVTLPAGTYTVSVSGLQTGVNCALVKDGVWFKQVTSSTTFTLTEEATISGYIYATDGIEVNTTVSIQLEVGEQATAYTTYISVTPHQVDLAGITSPIYGCELHLTTGEVWGTYGFITKNTATMDNSENYPGWKNSGIAELLGTGENSPISGCVTNVYPVSNYAVCMNTKTNDILYLNKDIFDLTQTEWIEMAIDVQFAIPLETPVLLATLTAQEIETLLGTNTIWSDADSIDIEYRADTGLFINQNSVKDVQIDGTSVMTDGVANVPIATANTLGTVKIGGGLYIGPTSGIVQTNRATSSQIKAGTSTNPPIVPSNQHESVFYGLATAAGDSTQKKASFAVGKYTDKAKQAIQDMLGITRIVATQETQYEPAVYRHPKGQTFLMNGLLFKALRDIEIGDTVLPEDNCNATNLNYAIFAPKETSTLIHPSFIASGQIKDVTLIPQINSLRANRLAFLPPDQVIIEKTIDGGVTWQDAQISDNIKSQLFAELRPSIYLPLLNGTRSTLCGIRITFTAMKYNVPAGTSETEKYNYWSSSYVIDRERYSTLREFYFWLNAGADKIIIKAQRAHGETPNSWETLFDNSSARFQGWSGNDYISFDESTFGGSISQVGQNWNYRITFMSAYNPGASDFNQTYANQAQSVLEIRGYGSNCWQSGNNYAGNDHLYSFDINQNAYFPRSVNAINFNGTINGYDIRKSVPADAVFTDTTYGNLTATSDGTAVSLVTTGDKYNWNQKVGDIQINGTSIVSDGVANIPIGSTSNLGVVKFNWTSGVKILSDTGVIAIDQALASEVKVGTHASKPIVPLHQHEAAFYGLAKAAGVDMASSSNAVGVYTDTAKIAIRNMIGATSNNVIAVQDEQPTDNDTKIWLPETENTGIQVPTMEDMANYVQKTDYASGTNYGIIKLGYGFYTSPTTGQTSVSTADSSQVKAANSGVIFVSTNRMHEAAFFGLSKAAGVDLANETVTVGTYPETSKTAIRSLIGAIGTTDYATSTTGGTIRINTSNGVNITNDGQLVINQAGTNNIKPGTANYFPIVPSHQHEATFYGLAKAAGDTTQSASSNAVGTYTNEAKAAIHTMLGIDPASIAAQVDIPLIETISGTTPTITGQPNIRYVCGEVSTLTITPPASGSVDVIFESGSTATTLTVPSTVKWPAWFNAEALESNTTYEILITDGTYGSVMTWAT